MIGVSPPLVLAKFIIISAAAFLVISCDKDNSPIMLHGVGKFCVPPELLPSSSGSVPEGFVEKDVGFAFSGCGRMRDYDASCFLPDEVIGVDVTTKTHAPVVRWGQLRSTAAFVMIEQSPATSLYGSLGKTWISAPEVLEQVYLFSGVSASSFNDFPGDAQLELSCDKGPVEREQVAFATVCRRYLINNKFSLEYRFEPRNEVIDQVMQFDKLVIMQLDRWRRD